MQFIMQLVHAKLVLNHNIGNLRCQALSPYLISATDLFIESDRESSNHCSDVNFESHRLIASNTIDMMINYYYCY